MNVCSFEDRHLLIGGEADSADCSGQAKTFGQSAFEQSTSTAKPDDEMQTVDRFWSISIFKGCMKCGDAAEFVAFMAELWHAELHWQ